MPARTNIRQDLLQRRREVLARYRGTVERADEELETREIEDIDRASENWDARVLSMLGHTDLREIGRLTDAISKIDDGTYGICDSCGEQIEAARIQALPTTTTCVDCAFEREQAERRVHAS